MSHSPFKEHLGVGLGLRPQHYSHILRERPLISWFEALSENYMGIEGGSEGRPLKILETLRKDYPIVLHGVSLSIGATDPLNRTYLKKLKSLVSRIEPSWISDHLCWTGVDGENIHDLLPLPFTEGVLKHLTSRIRRVQDYLGRKILLENVSSYLTYTHSEMSEWEFLKELCERADCGVLLDINNVYVSAVNQKFDPRTYIDAIPHGRVGQMHLAGHSDCGKYLLDTHDQPVTDPVWDLYRVALKRFGSVPTLIEWDAKIPEFEVLETEAKKALAMQKEVFLEGQYQQAALPT